ncbi:rac-like GTP-binding protein RAC9 isoform X1 [Venturia nashicola]|uniref:Rac-like GTP-binding protein RAC9 isoform X1 n=1 Tax=Venturia nashicola TaxID=86259 RepID=A0A4Z1NGM7_9PEZI|nr:rac-like GTP-binding protein RAC9 isoform X1 [Venturia nashicola]TLD20805.1 rac-like GTP-binding protein RAC9 isoform X1 [Venturia nashicola]
MPPFYAPEVLSSQSPTPAVTRPVRGRTSASTNSVTSLWRGKPKSMKPIPEVKLVTLSSRAKVQCSLLYAYTEDEYPSSYCPVFVEDVAISVLTGGETCNVLLSNTTGQESYDGLRSLNYRGPLKRDVILLCAEIGRDDDYTLAAEKWAPEARRFAPNTPYILVGVRCPRDDDEQVKPYNLGEDAVYGKAMARRMGALMYLECDVFTLQGVKQVFDKAIMTALNPPELPAPDKQKKLSRWGRSRSKESSPLTPGI